MDFETMYRAMDSRDRRFDGRFFVAVRSTGIYCRPICPAPSPKRRNTTFYRYAAVAERAGFRPCRRCRPEASPDTDEWDTRADLTGRGLRLIADGGADNGVVALARRLGVSDRHLQRVFKQEIGTTPGVIARSRRARLARQLLTETAMPITDVAFAAGFTSVRAFNETIKRIYRVTPTALRRGNRGPTGRLRVALHHRPPLAQRDLFTYLRQRAIPHVEEVASDVYRRAIRFGDCGATIELRRRPDGFELTIESNEVDPVAPVIQRARQLLDLDADPDVIDRHLARSSILQPLVRARPGLRLPGCYDPFEVVVQTVLQRGRSPSAAAAMCGRIAWAHGDHVLDSKGPLTRMFPTPDQLAAADLEALGLSTARATTLTRVAAAVRAGTLTIDGSMDPAEAVSQLVDIPGIGPGTASRIALRVLRDPDAFPGRPQPIASRRPVPGDRGTGSRDRSDEWRPWRGYAAMHLWAADVGA